MLEISSSSLSNAPSANTSKGVRNRIDQETVITSALYAARGKARIIFVEMISASAVRSLHYKLVSEYVI